MKLNSFLRKEPFSNLIVLNLHLRPPVVFIIVLCINIVTEILPGYLLGYWQTKPNFIGVIDDWPNLINIIIVIPSFWAFFAWIPGAIISTYGNMQDQGVIPHQYDEECYNLLERLNMRMSSGLFRITIVIITTFATVIGLYGVANEYIPPAWYVIETWYFWLVFSPKVFANFYVFTYSVMWSLFAVLGLNIVFSRFPINVSPYHEDGAGGVGFVGKMVFRMSRISIIIGIFLVSEIFGFNRRGQSLIQANILVELMAIPVLIITSFVAPLISCRNAMISAKQRELRHFAQMIQALLSEIIHDNRSAKDDIDKLTSLIDFLSKLRVDFPTLPLDLSIIRGFIVRVVGSLVPTVVGLAVQIINLIKP
jgi:hypothetical protein